MARRKETHRPRSLEFSALTPITTDFPAGVRFPVGVVTYRYVLEMKLGLRLSVP